MARRAHGKLRIRNMVIINPNTGKPLERNIPAAMWDLENSPFRVKIHGTDNPLWTIVTDAQPPVEAKAKAKPGRKPKAEEADDQPEINVEEG